MTQNLDTYLTNRCIKPEVQKYSQISYDNHKIVIPVFDKEGNKLFAKYRKDPDDTDPKNPKYTYEKGSSYTVYGYFPGYEPSYERVYFVEGEFDALVMQSQGVHALSSTGGCSSFKPEWFEGYKEVYICLDGDEAGKKASAKIALSAGVKVKIFIMLYNMDVTDYFMSGKTLDEFHRIATIDYEPPKSGNKASYKSVIDELMHQRRTMLQFAEDTTIIDCIVKTLTDEYNNIGKKITKPIGDINATYDIVRIKQIPITNFYTFGRDNKGTSIYNQNEKTPSMHYYQETNRFMCYSVGKGGDVIDFVQDYYGVNWSEAVAIIGKHL